MQRKWLVELDRNLSGAASSSTHKEIFGGEHSATSRIVKASSELRPIPRACRLNKERASL